MKSESVLRSACALVSEAEARVLYEALDQFVENLQNAISEESDGDEAWGTNAGKKAKLKTAEALLAKMDSAIAALAG
jgi:hypothetical protein